MTFQEYINGKIFQSLALYHTEEEVEEFTLCDFGLESFTAEGAIYWADVLVSEVAMFKNIDGIDCVWVNGVAAERVEEFQAAHAGWTVSESTWERWFQMVD